MAPMTAASASIAAGRCSVTTPADRARVPRCHHHRLGAGGRAVIEGGAGDGQAGEGGDLSLEFEQDLQRALGDLRLVGRVAGQELRALDDVVDAGRHVVAISAGAAKEGPRAGRPIARGQGGHGPLHLQLALVGGQRQGRL